MKEIVGGGTRFEGGSESWREVAGGGRRFERRW